MAPAAALSSGSSYIINKFIKVDAFASVVVVVAVVFGDLWR